MWWQLKLTSTFCYVHFAAIKCFVQFEWKILFTKVHNAHNSDKTKKNTFQLVEWIELYVLFRNWSLKPIELIELAWFGVHARLSMNLMWLGLSIHDECQFVALNRKSILLCCLLARHTHRERDTKKSPTRLNLSWLYAIN